MTENIYVYQVKLYKNLNNEEYIRAHSELRTSRQLAPHEVIDRLEFDNETEAILSIFEYDRVHGHGKYILTSGYYPVEGAECIECQEEPRIIKQPCVKCNTDS